MPCAQGQGGDAAAVSGANASAARVQTPTELTEAGTSQPVAVDERRYINVKYMDAQTEKVQRWYVEEPETMATILHTVQRD
eukprot:6060310-Pleurochrysis_carterae.AAC.1